MAWEARNGRGRYYTRSKRVNGRVIREYIGTGSAAELIAEYDAEKRRERLSAQETRKAARDDIESTRKLVDRCYGLARDLARLEMIRAGYYRHHRGEWRKRRGG